MPNKINLSIMIDNKKILKIIQSNRCYWWDCDPKKLNDLDFTAIVEGMLNYADFESIKELVEIAGIDNVADAFYQSSISNRRMGNYHIEVLNYFNLYFQRYAHRDFTRASKKVTAYVKAVFQGLLPSWGHGNCIADRPSALNRF
jgi:hypothetical protein